MTQEEKAKAYDEAIGRANELIYVSDKSSLQRKTVEHIFPELKENEDRKIKSDIQYAVRCAYGDNSSKTESILAWLEKQKTSEEAWQYLRENHSSSEMSDFQAAMNIAVAKAYNEGYNDGLEKQGEQKPIISDDALREGIAHFGITQYQIDNWLKKYVDVERQGKKKSADKVEPKFHEGEWITDGEKVWKIGYIEDDMYIEHRGTISAGGAIKSIDKHYHLWNIQDAKDGDVLRCENGWTCIFKTLVNDETFSSYCFMDSTKWFCETGSECHTLKEEFVKAYNGKIYPATKEQREQLEKAMTDAGYTFDFERKELKKIEQKQEDTSELSDFESALFTAFSDAWQQYLRGEEVNVAQWAKEHSEELLEIIQKELCKQNPAEWREEDERKISSIMYLLHTLGNNNFDSWLKSLKDRVHPKQGWSKEDERMIDNIIFELEENQENISGVGYKIDWLQSLKDRYTWKPSEEQMEALIKFVDTGNTDAIILESLYNDLKKL